MLQKSSSCLGTVAATVLLAGAFALSAVGCAAVRPAVPLEKTHWKLMEAEGVPAPTSSGSREPHIRFDSEKKRVTGYSGVNNFFGGYEISGEALRMPRLASTRRAGPPELMKLESAFLTALAATTSYHITGDKLELLDSSGRALARFQAQQIR